MSRLRVLLVSFFGFFAGSLILVLFTGSNVPRTVWAYGEDFQEKLRIFRLILETIQKSYVEEREAGELIEAAIHGVLEQLDPHTSYLPSDNFRRWNKNFEGFDGIGIYFDLVGERPMVTGFVQNSPAQKAGLKTGDFILKINGKDTRGWTRSEIERALIESSAERIRLLLYNSTDKKERKVTLSKTHIYLPSIPQVHLLPNQVGYVALSRFTGTTARELDRALDQLRSRGMKALVLDLRDNGGGYLSAAVEVADRFLPQGKLIVYTRGRMPRSFQEFRATRYHTYSDLPVVILLNHGTASAAEIVAGALQDWDRALIVGTTSFGKGLVQSQYRFRDGSALLVTTAKYYTPLGRCIQRDYFGMSKDEYYADAYIEHGPDQKQQRFRTPMGRIVYGGGGIVPDIHVENSNNDVSEFVRRLYFDDGRWFYRFALQYIKERPFVKTLPYQDLANLAITHKDLQEFARMLEQQYENMESSAFWSHSQDIAFLLKREIAYLSQGEQGRFWVNFERDRQLKTACEKVNLAEKLLHMKPIAQVLHAR